MEGTKLEYAPGSIRKIKRVGRGPGSGHGKTSCRGHKGQKSRSGKKLHPSFEGGQMRLIRRLPKRGFTNIFRKVYQVVNLSDLNDWEKDTTVEPETLKSKGLLRHSATLVKILGEGTLESPLTVKAHAFSASAKAKIESAGGTVEVIG
ncbi:MAG: 50S ribosomal protein L15 [Candidatus Latescibacteria bacterium]|nr:50S ribosomal protein L15 [Candidatus Latescibacterota bacterium]